MSEEDSDDTETEYSEDLRSVTGTDRTSGTGRGDLRNDSSSSEWQLDLPTERSRVLDDLANKHLQPEETALMIRRFQKSTDVHFSRTYQMGTAVRASLAGAHMPQVGLLLLPGADLPEVNRLEQNGMVTQLPDQRDAIWRVNTTGRLLNEVSVARDLSLVSQDITSNVASNAHKRMERNGQVTRRSHHPFRRDAVIIDSDNVEVVNDFGVTSKELDLCATLIEVNVSSLSSLMLDYRYIVANSGDQMTYDMTKKLLDRMIEAARRFCVRSPILFRMSTRTRIINSNNTRYGVDNEQGFQTFTTSKGIQEIIMMSASYFNSLDPSAPGMDKTSQAIIRPRFLQMLTLLLTLLNDYDLKTMSEFLVSTYGIIPQRSDLELLFLKVIPLTSINSKVFLQGLIPAVDKWPLSDQAVDNPEYVWRSFLKHLASRGYLLPASVEDLGHRQSSWVRKWPRGGVNSSTAFSRLQFHGESSATFNEIPTARFSYEPGLKELTVIMTNNETYTIHPSDYEQISTMTKGVYTAMRCEDSSIRDLEISEDVINGAINEAIRVINDAIRKFNFKTDPPSRQKRSKWVWKPKAGEQLVFRDLEAAGRLTRNLAMLDGNLLAVAYKLSGRNVPKSEAMRHMSYHFTRVRTLFNHLCEVAGRSILIYQDHIGRVNKEFAADRKAYQIEKDQAIISDAPIAQALGPDDAEIPSQKVWFDYFVNLVQDPRAGHDLLRIEARAHFVASVNWRRAGNQVEITLAGMSTNFFAAPLKPVSEAQQHDEVRVQDLALLVGRYIVIASPQRNDLKYPCIMTNWLEIQDAFGEEVSRRGRNFEIKEKHPATMFI